MNLGRERVYRLRAKALFGSDMTHTRFAELLQAGWRIKSNALTEAFGWPGFLAQHGVDAVLLSGVEPNGGLRVASNRRKTETRAGWSVIALVPPVQEPAVSA